MSSPARGAEVEPGVCVTVLVGTADEVFVEMSVGFDVFVCSGAQPESVPIRADVMRITGRIFLN